MMSWSIDDFLQRMSGNHIRVVNLGHLSSVFHCFLKSLQSLTYENAPEIDGNKENEVKRTVEGEDKYKQEIWN